MSKLKIIITIGTLITAVSSFNAVAFAATAHNSQTGANTSNSSDTYADALAKQRR